jgi:hypothetical protein
MPEEKRTSRLVHTTFHRSELDQIENWRRAQPEIPALAAAVRTFVIRGLKASSDVPAGKRPSIKDTAA